MILKYPILLELEDAERDFYQVTFPDFPGLSTFGEGIVDSKYKAKDVLIKVLADEIKIEPSKYLDQIKNNNQNQKIDFIVVNDDDLRHSRFTEFDCI